MLVPTLPAYTKVLGGSNLQASLVVGGFSISSLLSRLFIGDIADRMNRKPLIFIGFLILSICTLSYIFTPVIAMIIIRLVQGVEWGISSTVIAAVISDTVPTKRRGEGMGYYSLSMIVSMSIAPILAITIMNKYSFYIISVACIILICIGSAALQSCPISKSNIKNKNGNIKREFHWSNFFEKRALLPSLLCSLLAITLCAIMSYIMIFGKEVKITNIWIYFIGHVLMILITRPFVGRIFDKRGHKVVILPGAVCMIAGLITLSYTNSIRTLVIASLLYGFGYGAAQPSLQAWAINRSPVDRRGVANGTFLSSMDVGFTVGSIILSLVAEAKSYAVMYRVSSVAIIIFVIIYVSNLVLSKRNENKLNKNIA
jgi:MFS family permease